MSYRFTGSTRAEVRQYLDAHGPARGRREVALHRLLAEMLERFDFEAFDALAKRHLPAGISNDAGAGKYFDIVTWLGARLRQVLELGLDHRSPLRLLDLGTGFGYFPFAANCFGHVAAAFDVEDPLYAEVTRLLGVDVREVRIQPNQPLPAPADRFDVVTGFMVSFNVLREGEPPAERLGLWDAPTWRAFFDDVFENQLASDGTLYLVHNDQRAVDGLHHYDPAYLELLESTGRPFRKCAEKLVVGNLERCELPT